MGGLIGATISRKVIGRFPLGRVYFVAQSALLLGARGALTVAAIGSAAVVIALIVSPLSRLRDLPPAAKDPTAANAERQG